MSRILKDGRLSCPICHGEFVRPTVEFHGKKGTCPACGNRLLLSDRSRFLASLALSFNLNAAEIANPSASFGVRVVKLCKKLDSLLGLAKPNVSVVYGECWLVPGDKEVTVFCGELPIGQLSKKDSISFFKSTQNLVAMISCPAKFASNPEVKENRHPWQVFLDVPFLQHVKLEQPRNVPLERVAEVAASLIGKTPDSPPGFGIKNASLFQTIDYLKGSTEERERIVGLACMQSTVERSIFWGSPKEIANNGLVTWVDNDWKYEITLKIDGCNVSIVEARELSPDFFRVSRTQRPGLRGKLQIRNVDIHS
jgi:hypothetical protein